MLDNSDVLLILSCTLKQILFLSKILGFAFSFVDKIFFSLLYSKFALIEKDFELSLIISLLLNPW